MKRLLLGSLILGLMLPGAFAQQQPAHKMSGMQQPGEKKAPLSPPGSASVSLGGKLITITYSRPSMRGRKIMGELVPFDQVWRTGANSATSLVTAAELTINGTRIPAGSYTLYTLPSASGWKLIVNKQTGQWGTEYHAEQDLARIDMNKQSLSSPAEQFTMSFEKASEKSAVLKMQWENTEVSVPIESASAAL